MSTYYYVIVRERDGRFYNVDDGKFYRSKDKATKFEHWSSAQGYLTFLGKQEMTILGLYS